MEKLSLESKNIYLMGDYNIDHMKIKIDVATSQFFDTITSNLYVPHITYPTRISTTRSTLIDNIFSNTLNFMEGTSGNLTIDISDHLAQFLIIDTSYLIYWKLTGLISYLLIKKIQIIHLTYSKQK